jgi:thiol:disulfide interchange protein
MKISATIALGLALISLLAGCRLQSQAPTEGNRVNSTPPKSSNMAVVVTDKTLDAALSAAKKDGKPVIAIFSAPSWCQWCQKLDKETLGDAQVQAELKKYHVVFVDSDKEQALASKYGISGVPQTILFNGSGKNVSTIRGFREAKPFLDEINKALGGA